MKKRYTTLATGIALGLAVGIPAQALAAEHGAGMQQAEPGTAAPGTTQTSAQQGPMGTLTVTQLEGMAVINAADEEIGEIEEIVRDRADDRLRAVVSVGGFLGLGDKQVTIPLDEMYVEDGRLRSPLASTQSELENRDAYNADMHERIGAAERVQVSSGPGQMQGSADRTAMDDSPSSADIPGFGTLDVNRDGYLSKDEADRNDRISENWQQVDANEDGRIDRSEFAAFEVQESPASTPPDTGMSRPGTQTPMGDDGRM